MNKRKVTRILNRLYLLLIVPIKEKTFISHEGSEQLHYLFFQKKEKVMY